MRTLILSLVGLLLGVPTARAQTFSSGSTGADGALDLSAMSCVVCEIQLPESGILNYTTVTIPYDKKLTFKKNRQNTPAVLLAQGAVWIAGTISVDAGGLNLHGYSDRTIPGPGGFAGSTETTQPGLGPGGGAVGGEGGKWVGPLSLVPIIGGSGGSGGGGGGGAILIASSTSITVTGSITAIPDGPSYGSGGAIRLVANSVSVSNQLLAVFQAWNGRSNPGLIRLEAPPGAVSFTGTSDPLPVISSINPALLPSAPASLSIVSIAGYPVPAYAGNRKDAADLVLPNQLPEPISVAVAAHNIPPGSQVNLTFGTSNTGTVTPGTLAGTFESSIATVAVSGLNRMQLAYFYVSVVFEVPPDTLTSNLTGRDRIVNVRAEARPGAPTQFAFLRADGTEVERSRVPAGLLRQFDR